MSNYQDLKRISIINNWLILAIAICSCGVGASVMAYYTVTPSFEYSFNIVSDSTIFIKSNNRVKDCDGDVVKIKRFEDYLLNDNQ